MGGLNLALTGIEADVVRVIESEVPITFKLSVNLYRHMRNFMH